MKKFFSLVLALVMALSLTTVAWGATVAKIGTTEYDTLDAAITAANGMSGDVTIEIYGVAEYSATSPSLTGAYDSITFVGKTADAEIRMTRNGSNGYMSGSGAGGDCTVNFENLILSKPGGSWAGDAGHMSVFFTVYRVAEVHYTNCVFPDGACASGCKTTYTECEFANTTSGEYSLWVYGNADVTVTGGEFTGVRGVKMYAEGRGKNSDLVMEDVVFTDSVTEKPAVVLTFGGSVELSGNTYPSKGMFELSEGSDADPNGTTITADVDDISCTSDSQADCGVLVDGKIYKTLTEADAANAIQDSSTVELFYNSNEVIELPDNVTMDANGYTNACGDDITTDANGKITGGTFDTDVSDFLANGYFQNANGVVVTAPNSTAIPSTGAILAPTFADRTDVQYVAWDANVVAEDAENSKKFAFATYSFEMIAKVNNAPLWWASGVEEKGEDVNFKIHGEDEFVKVATKDQADFVLVDGKNVTYFAYASDYNTKGWDEKADMVVLPYVVPAKRVCDTDYAADQAAPIFYEFNDTLYVASTLGTTGAEVFNVNGVAVAVVKATNGVEYVNIGHKYVVETATNNYGEFEVTKVLCKDCKNTFKFVVGPEELAVTTFGAYNYDDAKDLGKGVHVWVGTAATYVGGSSSGTPSTDKVTSAETFDAGIAMYVGMSVMAAAGSAVVLKKRED